MTYTLKIKEDRRMNPLREMIRIRALEIIAIGAVKKEILLAQLGGEFIAATKDDYHWVIDDMVIRKQAIELEYIHREVKKSILFPFDCDLFIKFSNGVHSFSREIV